MMLVIIQAPTVLRSLRQSPQNPVETVEAKISTQGLFQIRPRRKVAQTGAACSYGDPRMRPANLHQEQIQHRCRTPELKVSTCCGSIQEVSLTDHQSQAPRSDFKTRPLGCFYTLGSFLGVLITRGLAYDFGFILGLVTLSNSAFSPG